MKELLNKTKNIFNTRIGFFILAIALFWAKTYWAYQTRFSLGVEGGMQQFLLALNPIPFMILLFGIALYMNGRKSYIVMLIIDALASSWIFANIIYYREFSDFLTLSVIKGSGAVANNMDTSIAELFHPGDLISYLDVVVLIALLAFKVIKIDKSKFKLRYAFSVTAMAVVLFGINLGLAEKDRPQLLTRTFDRNYIVKYLGLNAFTVYDAVQTSQANAVKANADSSDMDSVLKFLNSNRAGANAEYYGKAKGKNVFIIHLESVQQFMIDYKSNGEEVTPTINALYHDANTMSFDNFFHQVGQGKTADAEMMLENSLFGLAQGSAMVTAGTSNTFQAMPSILDQQGYTTASFHGDVGSFWNRDNTYKSWGYDYFFDSQYYPTGDGYNIGYGLKDKIFLKESAKYIEQLPQPFYAKLITVTNHYPYGLDKANTTIAKTTTGDSTVDGYVQTARYLDESIKEFITYLKSSGLYDNSMLVLYGDHYGISSNHKKAVAQLLGKEEITDFDDAMFQKVPFMIHMTGLQGGVNHTYGGEIDVMPTLLDLLGVSNTDTVQFGQDLLSAENQQIVSFRNGDFVSKDYTKIGSKIYNTATGVEIVEPTADQEKIIKTITEHVQNQLTLSDKVISGDLLRFYTPANYTKVNKKDYNYKLDTGLANLKNAKNKNTSILAQNNNVSTADSYVTNAPELVK